MRIVLDTSVLVAGIRSRRGAAAELLRLALTGQVGVLLDLKLSLEYRDVLLRPAHLKASGLKREQMKYLLDQLEGVAEAVEIRKSYRLLSSDPADDMVLELAINGMADAVVTNNVRHMLQAAGQFGIEVFTARELLELWLKTGE